MSKPATTTSGQKQLQPPTYALELQMANVRVWKNSHAAQPVHAKKYLPNYREKILI